MLVAYGVRQDGLRELLSFMRSQGESQGAWEGLLNDLYRRGLHGKHLQLIITDGCAGLACCISVVGCTRCATFARKGASGIAMN